MSKALRILILEDRSADAELVTRELRQAGFEFVAKSVATEAAFVAELRSGAPQLILADYSLPGYDGFAALAAAQERCPATPFIFVSGSLGEEAAIEALRRGATDFVLKQRMARLEPAVRRALREREEVARGQEAEKERHEAEARYRALFEQSPDGIVILDPETARPLEFNTAAHQQLGYSREEFARLSLADIDAAETPEQTRATIEGARQEGKRDFETRQRTRDGQIRHVHVTAQIVQVSGRPVYHCVWRDITQRKQAEEALCQSEAELAEARRLAKYGNWSWDIAKDEVTWSEELYEIFGVEKTSFRHAYDAFSERVEPAEREAVLAASRKARAEGKPFEIVYGIRTPQGEKRVIRELGYAIRDEAGRVVRLVGTAQDITAEKQAEAELRWKTAFLEAQVNSSLDGIMVVNAEGRKILQNQRVNQLWKIPPEIADGLDDHKQVEFVLQKVKNPQAFVAKVEYLYAHPSEISRDEIELTDGTILDRYSAPVVGQDGSYYGRIWTFRDITDRRRLEQALRESSQFNQQTVASAHEGIIVYGRDLKFQVWNPFMERLTGRLAGQVLGKHPAELFPLWREAGLLASIRQALAGKTTAPLELQLPDLATGKSCWAACSNGPLRNATGEIIGVIGIVRDITERKRAEESYARLATAVEQSAETILITDAKGTILYANPAFEETSGYARKEVIGQNPRLLKSGKHDAEFYRQMWSALGRGEVWSGRLINKKKDGTLYEEDATISPVRDAAGKVVNYVAVKRDITREAQLEAQLRQSQKMDAVGHLAGGVAHDFNNMLAIIRGNAELMLMDEEQYTAETKEGLKHIVDASERAANLTRQLLAFSRKQVLQPQPLVLNDLLANLTKMLKRIIGENIDLQCHYATPLPYVQADPGMLEQVILNLVVNARDAMPAGGQLRLATERLSLDSEHARDNPEARAGEFVCLEVSDTGTGIAPEILPQIFEPFFTTKEIGKGTGLGLATVYGIVRQHQGWIEVSTQMGKGSAFKMFLPSIPTPTQLPATAEAGADIRGGNETILLAEDEDAVRMTTRRVLESKGYQVREANTGREALELWRQHEREIALLVTDLIMPGDMSGRDLAERLWEQRPGLKVIFMSGYSADVLGKGTDFIRRVKAHFLQKPASSQALLETVRRCLDE